MSKEEKPKASSYWGISLIIAALLLLLLVGAGYVWARINLENNQSSTTGIPEEQMDSSDQNSRPDTNTELENPRVLVTVPVPPTTSAPVVPTAVATSEPISMPLPTFDNPVNERFVEEAAAWKADFAIVNDETTGVWQYEVNNFVRPVALEAQRDTVYLLDGGRVLSLNLNDPKPPVLLLSPGDEVNGVRVLEPLDLALMDGNLFVLDRAGDIYRYDLRNDSWDLDRYDRPVEASSGHYFVAIDVPSNQVEDNGSKQSRTLLETNYKFAMQYGGDDDSLWNLPEGRSVDVTVIDDDIYVLQRGMFDSAGIVTKYRDTRSIKDFAPQIEIDMPRQIVATETAVFILDKDGQRLLALDPGDGKLLRLIQMPLNDSISVFAVDPAGRMYLAGQDRLYLLEQPDRIAAVPGGPVQDDRQPHDPLFLRGLSNLTVPIGGSNITFRDFQMPGAPRHYRLGVHEGLDFYWQPGTKVLAAADGLVIRADLDYVGPTAAQLATWWNETQEEGYTTPETLDNYLGRQVWIQHDGGLVTRYAHLRSIAPGIAQGVEVSRGQSIGEVGNSGSPASLESERSDAHLHFEIWLGDKYLGQFMRPIETREWIERILPNRE